MSGRYRSAQSPRLRGTQHTRREETTVDARTTSKGVSDSDIDQCKLVLEGYKEAMEESSEPIQFNCHSCKRQYPEESMLKVFRTLSLDIVHCLDFGKAERVLVSWFPQSLT